MENRGDQSGVPAVRHQIAPRKSLALGRWVSVALGLFCGCVTQTGDRTVETFGRVTGKGKFAEAKGSASVGMRASASYRQEREGVKITVDGNAEPMLYTADFASMNELRVGERVRVTYKVRGSLFGQTKYILKVSKIRGAN